MFNVSSFSRFKSFSNSFALNTNSYIMLNSVFVGDSVQNFRSASYYKYSKALSFVLQFSSL